ncbi:tol [Fusarium pseudoanthophilum]|uniref:Tol n=1 Tax=Fusarium pseudoanthophilum TaxID=48495 RepID=A0A8H5NMN6_9HYPO|nr:tol [Fusarium pseudoanthophilum]
MPDIKSDIRTLQPHTLCSLCTSFWESATCIRFRPEVLLNGGDDVPSMPQHLLFSPSRTDVLSAASQGCHFCSIIIGAVVGCTGDHGDRQFSGDKNGPVYISIAVLNTDAEIHGGIKADHQHLSSTLQSTTYSDATADFVRSWITECQSTHILCGDDLLSLILGSTETKARPRRLLDLLAFQDIEKIRLIEANNDHTKEYCALSYSWGFSKPYVMTSSNLAAFQKEIHVKDLPKLLQDSIRVVRGLGFRYLWIDALCIMQDGSQSSAASDDWVDQAGKMNDIFGNAAVTIAAAECFDGNSSMIVPRNPLSQLSCRLNASTNLYYEVVPPCTPHCLLHPFDKARFHLDTRAWVFQERILSPRTVHLTRNFVHLECRTELLCGAMGGHGACYHSGAIAKADYQVLFSMFGPNGLDDSAHDAFLSFWHELIRRYSTTNLSRPSDLLAALAGLARQVQIKSQLTWSFGLWQEHLLRDMLWYIRGGRGAPCRERSPTWSWASVDVQGPQIIYEPATQVSLLADIISLPDATDFVGRGLLVDATKHCVKVSGLLRPGAPDLLKYGQDSASSMNKDIRVHRNCQGIRHIHRQCPFHPDYDLPNNIELYSLLIACASGAQQKMGSSQNLDTHLGIVLTPAPEHERRYRRVGYFHIDIQETDDDDQGIPWVLESSSFVEIEVI